MSCRTTVINSLHHITFDIQLDTDSPFKCCVSYHKFIQKKKKKRKKEKKRKKKKEEEKRKTTAKNKNKNKNIIAIFNKTEINFN